MSRLMPSMMVPRIRLLLAAVARMSPQQEMPSLPPAMTRIRSSVVTASMTGVIRCVVGAASVLAPTLTVLARPTIFGQFQSGRIPKVAPWSSRKSKASDTVLVFSAKRRLKTLALLILVSSFRLWWVNYGGFTTMTTRSKDGDVSKNWRIYREGGLARVSDQDIWEPSGDEILESQ